jgi:hypothetical protein
VWENIVNNSATATKIAVSGGDNFARTGLGYNVLRYYWVKSVDYSGNVSAFSSVASATTLFVDTDSFSQAVNDLFQEAGAYGIEPVSSLPSTGDFNGQIKYLTTTNKLYRWDSSTSAWTDDIFSITSGSVDAASFASGIEPISIVSSLPNPSGYTGPQLVFLTTDYKLYRYNGSAFVSSIAAGDITGTIGSDVFPNNLRPVEIVSTLPTSGNFQGRQVFLTSDNKLYRYNGTSFIASVATSDLQGQVSSTQISDNSISTAKIQADAITANEIATGAVTADAITAGSISSAAIAADAITSNKIAANAVTAGAIQAGAVSTDALAANVITSDKIAAGAIQTSDLAANSITGGLIAASGVITSAAQIDDAVITSAKIDNLAVTQGKIANLAVDTLKIADAAVFVEETASLASGFGISPADGWTTIVSKSIVLSDLSSSSAVIINGIVQATNVSAAGEFFNYRIRRGTTVLKQFEAFILANFALNETAVIPLLFVDTPSNGTFTYEIQARDPSGSGSIDTMYVDLGIISIGAAKR